MRIRSILCSLGMGMAVLGMGMSFSACAPKKIRHSPQGAVREHLFPRGLYKHDVQIVVPKTSHSKEFKFQVNGVVRLNPDTIQMVALSHFGTTVFKINENLTTGEIKTEVFVDEMKRFESKLSEYYSILRLFLIARVGSPDSKQLKWTEMDSQGLPLEAQTQGFEKNAVFHFRKYDENGIPEEVQILHPNFSILVKVAGYEI